MTQIVEVVRTLAENEVIISRGLMNFVETGRALLQIREQKQYREAGHKTFEDYVSSRWQMGRAHAYRFIEAAKVEENLSPIGDKTEPPKTESVARAVSQASKDPETQREIWVEATSVTPEPTAADVKQAAERVAAAKAEEPKPHPSVNSVFDHFKVAVHDDFVPAFESRKEFKAILSKISGLKQDIQSLCEEAGGSWIDAQDVERLCNELRRAVRFGMPYTECGRCKRSDVKRSKCQSCKGRGWLCEAAYNTQSAEDKAWIANRK